MVFDLGVTALHEELFLYVELFIHYLLYTFTREDKENRVGREKRSVEKTKCCCEGFGVEREADLPFWRA